MSSSSPTVSKSVAARWPTNWLPVVALLAIAGAMAGYFLPTDKSQQVPSKFTGPSDGATESLPTAAEQKPASSLPVIQPTANWLHEFPLSAADVRDTQEAPALAIDSRGHISLAWASKTSDTERKLSFTSSGNKGQSFDQPRTIATSGIFKSGSGAPGKGGGHERRMLPRLAIGGDTLLLGWCDAPLDGSSVRMLLAQSRDGGRTFSEPAPIHETDAARPTFTSLAANAKGEVVASWLDCRNGPQQVFAAAKAPDSPDFMPDLMVFAGQNGQGVCPCCPTASLVTDDSAIFVAFRSQIDGYRDTWISRFDPRKEDRFSEPMPVVPPTWQFDGCPHDGPSLAVSGEWIHIAWMDAHSGRQRVYYGQAKLADMKFDVQELNAVGPGTQGNVKLCIDFSGRLHAVWEESLADEPPPPAAEKAEGSKWGGGSGHQHGTSTGAGRAIMHACSRRADGIFDTPQAIRAQPGRFQMRPTIACGAEGLIVAAWMELDEAGKRVVVIRLPGTERVALVRPIALETNMTESAQSNTAAPVASWRTALFGLAASAVLMAAVVTGRWLRTRSTSTPTASTGATPVTSTALGTPRVGRGEIVFQVHCAKCHGPEGHGDPEAMERLRPPPRDFAMRPWRFEVSLDSIRRVTVEGISTTAMPAHRAALSADDLEAVVTHTYRIATTGPIVSRQSSPLEQAIVAAGFTPESSPRVAPELTLSNADGQVRTLANERGRTVLLIFWGTTCEHCLAGMPNLQALAERWQPRGLTVLNICADADSASAAQDLVTRVAPGMQSWIDESGLANSHFEVHTLPTIWIIDRSGHMLASTHGMKDWSALSVQDFLDFLMRTSTNEVQVGARP